MAGGIELAIPKTKSRLGGRMIVGMTRAAPRDVVWCEGKKAPKGERARAAYPGVAQRGRTAVMHTVPLAFMAHAVVILWYLEEGDAKRDVCGAVERSPWSRHKKKPSFADMLIALRRETWAGRLSEHPADQRVLATLSRLLPDVLLAA